ncbi:MAG: class I SAM-dependent methyltransferase [Candidatus Coatesbacteria bacterium]|nr:class I SAM-dependent methyltransferase [Candidatus Coatesbacteria bacterium]
MIKSSFYHKISLKYHPVNGIKNTCKVIKLLDIRTGQRVLDAGCGYGRMIPFILERTGKDGYVEGWDTDKILLGQAQEAIQNNNCRIFFKSLSEKPEEAYKCFFDRIILNFVIHETPEKEWIPIISNLLYCLKDDGLLGIFDFGRPDSFFMSLFQKLYYIMVEEPDHRKYIHKQINENYCQIIINRIRLLNGFMEGQILRKSPIPRSSS